jgi:dynamin 1-like protein
MILLAVVPATSTSPGATYLRKARDADWNGDRTIGVVTKLDCADVLEEGRMEQLLFAKTYRLPLGFHAVHYQEQQLVRFVTRSVGDTRSDEQLFFECHHRWNKLPGSCWGIPKLWDRLVSTHLTLVKTEALAAVEERLAKANGALSPVRPPMDTPLQRRTMFLSLAEFRPQSEHLLAK